jgi:hypothetical protein
MKKILRTELKCDECGKILASAAELKLHGAECPGPDDVRGEGAARPPLTMPDAW